MPWGSFYLSALLEVFYLCLVALRGGGALTFCDLTTGNAIVWGFDPKGVYFAGYFDFWVHVFWYLNFIRIRQLVVLVMWWLSSFAYLLLVCQNWGVWTFNLLYAMRYSYDNWSLIYFLCFGVICFLGDLWHNFWYFEPVCAACENKR